MSRGGTLHAATPGAARHAVGATSVRARAVAALARVACVLCVAFAAPLARAADGTLAAFDDAGAWRAVASDQIEARLRPVRDASGAALCLDFDFHGVSGYAAMRRRLPIEYPENYAFTFRVRGDAPDNALQFKLADASGDDVWWVNREDFAFPHDWTRLRYKKREIAFAWGPATDRTLHRSDSVEFTVYAGHGGRGSVCFADLALHELPPPPATWPAPVASASSSMRGAPPALAVDGDAASAWRSDPRRGGEQSLTLNLGATREFGGLVLRWAGAAFASRYDVELSADARDWRVVRRVVAGDGGADPLYLPESEARYVRLRLHDGPRKAYALADVDVKDLAYGASANAFFAELAKAAPRGHYPRGFYGEQTYWTVVGLDGGHESGLLSEDGALEVSRGGFSIEPFLIEDDDAGDGSNDRVARGRGGDAATGDERASRAPASAEADALTSWADATIGHALNDRSLPIPSVVWDVGGLRLTTTAFADGRPGASRLLASYTLENRSERPRTVVLALAVRPFQVNPAVQFLNTPGGVSPIHDLGWRDRVLSVDGRPRVEALETPARFAAAAFDAGTVVPRLTALAHGPAATPASATASQPGLAAAAGGRAVALHDDTGLASGALLYRVALAPRASRTLALAVPLDGAFDRAPAGAEPAQWIAARRAAVAADWRARLGATTLRLPAAAQPLADTLRSALAQILVSRDGAALRPGTRSYARSWIRDGAMMAEALLRLGRADVARAYLDWYLPYPFANGKVPCCVDARGADPVPENDSHGELIHLAYEVYRYTGDRDVLERAWPQVDAAARYMDALRASERNEANRSGERAAFYGLMPASISHEGYSAKPMHSYWDDFWALTGYDDAVAIADALGRGDDARRLARSRDEFRGDLYASIRTAVAAHGIDYLPGSAELGDFDATSTTIALAPAGQQDALPADLLRGTFERYWTEFAARRDLARWSDYTPYEWRNVGAFVRLGWRERADAAAGFFMRDRRPAAWNQWAEVVGRDPRASRFIGDMPHGWVASDFIRATLDRFVYERASDHALVLAAGVPAAWLDGDGIAIENLATPYGPLGFALKRDGDALVLDVDGRALRTPPGGLVLAPPKPYLDGDARLDGRRLPWRDGTLTITTLPAHLRVTPHESSPAPR
ncbi:MAG TPA: discoidin domain-containing protein [Dokdonella sp.]